jgi:hypothetical protein
MEDPYIVVKLLEIRPGAGYEGRVYDQYVVMELPDGKIIDVFDPTMICRPEQLGSVKKVTIYASLVKIVKVSNRQIFGITPSGAGRTPNLRGGHGHIFRGEIDGKVERSRQLIVNIGYGRIYSDARGCYEDFEVGESVEIYGVRADLDKILQ